MLAFLRKYFYQITLTGCFILAFFLRWYRLDTLPDMLQIDEAGLGVNAWCLTHYGVDRHLNEMPVYLQNFSRSGQSPLYTYSVVLLLKTIGQGNLSLLLIRIPGFLSSMLVVICGTKLMALVFQNKNITLMSALLLTICPYFIMHGRFALDCEMMLSCSTISLYLLIKYINSQRLSALIICGISFGITLYSYALSYFLLPMFLILITFYLLYMHKITFSHAIIWALSICITGLPIILFVCSLLFQLEPFPFLGFVISPVSAERLSDIASENFFSCIADALRLTLTHGTRTYEAIDKFCTMYPISIPFIITGFFCCCKDFVHSVKKRCFHHSAVFALFFLCSLLTIGMTRAHHIYPANYYFISYLYFVVLGIHTIYQFVFSHRRIFMSVICASYLLWGLSFFRYYFTVYSVADIYGEYHVAPFEEALKIIETQPNIKNIYIDCYGIEEYFLFYRPQSPFEAELMGHESGIKNFCFEINSDTPVDAQNAYIVHGKNSKFINNLLLSGYKYHQTITPPWYIFYPE